MPGDMMMQSETEQDHRELVQTLERAAISGTEALLPKHICTVHKVPNSKVKIELEKLRKYSPVQGSDALRNIETGRYFCSLCLHRNLRETELTTQPSQGDLSIDYFKCRVCDWPYEVPQS